jgi:ubiquinone biosynthesis protein COQ4
VTGSWPIGIVLLAFLKALCRDNFVRVPRGCPHSFSPDERSVVRFVEEPELRYVMQRYREVHDFLHALTDLPPTVHGEIALKWFEMVQTGLPMCALSAFVAPLRLPPHEMLSLVTTYIPWAAHCAARAEFAMVVPFEAYLDEPLATVQARLRITQPPASLAPPAPILE